MRSWKAACARETSSCSRLLERVIRSERVYGAGDFSLTQELQASLRQPFAPQPEGFPSPGLPLRNFGWPVVGSALGPALLLGTTRPPLALRPRSRRSSSYRRS